MSVRIPFRSAPKIGEGKLFATTIDDQLYALDANNGAVLWTHRGMNEQAGVMNSISPTLVPGAVLVPYSSGEIYMLATGDGNELWQAAVSSSKRSTQSGDLFTGIGGDPVVDGQVVFAVSNGGVFGVLGLDQGQPLWNKPVASFNTPWVAGDYVFLLTADNTLVCFMKYEGRVRWATKLEGFEDMERKLHPITWRGPVVVNGQVAVVSSTGKLVLANAADGTIESTKDVPEDIYTAPVVAGGSMYLISKNATLYSLK
jgi:outer membrane protein assembly factor BamB